MHDNFLKTFSTAFNFVLFFYVYDIVPAPTSIIPSANGPTPLQQNGILTCVIHINLSSEMDVPLTVNTTLRGPDGQYIVSNISQPVAGGTTTTYTSAFAISSALGRNLSGNYTCVATLNPTQISSYILSSRPIVYTVQFVKSGKVHNTDVPRTTYL